MPSKSKSNKVKGKKTKSSKKTSKQKGGVSQVQNVQKAE